MFTKSLQVAWLLIAASTVYEFHCWRVVDSAPAVHPVDVDASGPTISGNEALARAGEVVL